MIFAFDTETYLIRPGLLAPRVVCVQSTEGGAELREPGLDRLERALRGDAIIVGHNVAFDAAATIATRPSLLPLWLDAYHNDRVTCTMVREKLIRIAQGRSKMSYGLLDCISRWKLTHDFKADDKSGAPDSWRLRYGELDGVPVDQWPHDAKRYALADLVVEDLYRAQQSLANYLADEYRQARASFVLHLTSASGMRVDQANAREFHHAVNEERERVRQRLVDAGIVRPTGTRNVAATKERVLEAYTRIGISVPTTEKGNVSTSADTCQTSQDPVLIDYARYTTLTTLRSRTARLIAAGDMPVQPRYNVLVDSGRTSCSAGDMKPGARVTSFGDQVQNLMREPGLRECYRARPGYVLCSVDFSTAELHSLAQVCLWLGEDSDLARTLNAGDDPHIRVACALRGWAYPWAAAHKKTPEVKAGRQAGKALNFGFPGGLGIAKFRLFADKTYGVVLSHEEAVDARNTWFATYREMRGYFAHIQQITSGDKPRLKHFKSDRWRGDVRYTSAANSYFQGHTADMAKDAGWRILRSVHQGKLRGCRLWAFVHDEWILEVPADRAPDCAMEVVRLMEDAGREWCPDVPCRAEPALSYHWRKGAEPTYRDGKLIPWEDRESVEDADVPGLGRVSLRYALDALIDPRRLSWYFGITEERARVCG